MKVKLELDPDQKETEITIHAGQLTPEIERIYQQLQMDLDHPNQIEGMMDNTSYYLSINDILFFETDAKQVMAHMTRNAYFVKYKLYELESLLGGQFMRILKSTILNLDQIYAITKSISNCQIKFHDSYKTVYVSRRYYRDLNDRLKERRALS